ncbi:MAG: hypothetical protein Q7U91_13780 [Sideroxyarcus sp.]|nr:hypothetical protein [Sideroxyarcus sp.]
MNLQAVYVKTAKGQEELATRAFKLPSRVRNLLVMVDGMRTGDQVVEMTAVLGDSSAFFSLLVEEGFVEPAASAAPAAEKAVSVSNAPPKALVQGVCRLVTDLLGPAGDSLTLRLEKTRTLEEFAKQVEMCRSVVENAVGKKKGDQFWDAVVAQLSV